MYLKKIFSDRHFEKWPSWDIIYEWEDIISRELNIPIKDSRNTSILNSQIDRGLRYFSRFLGGKITILHLLDLLTVKKPGLYFEMLPRNGLYFTGSKNTVPVIIDFWKSNEVKKFSSNYRNCKAIFITSLEVFDYLKANRIENKIYHFPFSLSDNYADIETNNIRKYDLIIAGRANPILLTFLKQYEKENPEIEYVYQKGIDGELFYFSNKTGVLGNFQDRSAYMGLLKQCKIAFYATPGIDGDEMRTGGFSPVTPRFLELLSAGCKIIARYPKNADTDFFELPMFCASITTYEAFCKKITTLLSEKEISYEFIRPYFRKHQTTARIEILKNILCQIK